MKKVYFKTNLELIDSLPGFFGKLKDFAGDFAIEGMDYNSFMPDVIVISFYTDKIDFIEGEPRQVSIEAETINQGDKINDWHFTKIIKA